MPLVIVSLSVRSIRAETMSSIAFACANIPSAASVARSSAFCLSLAPNTSFIRSERSSMIGTIFWIMGMNTVPNVVAMFDTDASH